MLYKIKKIKDLENLTYKDYFEYICEECSKIVVQKYQYKNIFNDKLICSSCRRKQTNLKKYGVDNPWKSKEIQKKIKQTNLEKYGLENIFLSSDIQNKIKKNIKKQILTNMDTNVYLLLK